MKKTLMKEAKIRSEYLMDDIYYFFYTSIYIFLLIEFYCNQFLLVFLFPFGAFFAGCEEMDTPEVGEDCILTWMWLYVHKISDNHIFYRDKTCDDYISHLDTFLFESDTPTKLQEEQERKRAEEWKSIHGEGSEIRADILYKERLHYARVESQKLFDNGIVARIVYSGAKSYHLMLRVSDAPNNLDEYKWLHAYLCTVLSDKLVFDESTSDPARLTRSPLTLDRVTSAYGLLISGEQKLIAENWSHVYTIDWRPIYQQWLDRPLKKYEQKAGKPLYPTREEYRAALEALIDGSFWTDDKFNGNRQRLFFPVYRLLRVLGYSHNEAWNNIIIPKLKNYKKQNEVGYWQSRKNSAIIMQIDSEINEYDEKWEAEDE